MGWLDLTRLHGDGINLYRIKYNLEPAWQDSCRESYMGHMYAYTEKNHANTFTFSYAGPGGKTGSVDPSTLLDGNVVYTRNVEWTQASCEVPHSCFHGSVQTAKNCDYSWPALMLIEIPRNFKITDILNNNFSTGWQSIHVVGPTMTGTYSDACELQRHLRDTE